MCITFLQIPLKVLSKDIFPWLELNTEILSFLQIFIVRKTITPLFLIFQKLPEYQQKKLVSGIFWAFKSKLQVIHGATYIALFLPDSNNFFFICLVPYIHYLSLLFCHFVFLFSPFSFSFRHETHFITAYP